MIFFVDLTLGSSIHKFLHDIFHGYRDESQTNFFGIRSFILPVYKRLRIAELESLIDLAAYSNPPA